MLLLLLLLQADPSTREARIQAQALAEASKLYEEFTGRKIAAPSDLQKKADGVEFWPEGGFWRGPLPKDPWGGEYRISERKVAASRDGVAVPIGPFEPGRIVPSSDRLKKHYAARVQVQLAGVAGRAFERRTGKPPKRLEDFGSPGKDPWDHDYEIVDRGTLTILRLADPALRYVQPDEPEGEAMAKSALLPLTPEELKTVEAALDRMADDDYDVRKAAAAELCQFGRVVLPRIQERLKLAKDSFVKSWLNDLSSKLPGEVLSWRRHLTGLSVAIGTTGTMMDKMKCQMNLHQLSAMQFNFALQHGGGERKMNPQTGSAFWLALSKTDPPLVKDGDPMFVCPCSGVAPKEGVCTLRGPIRDVNTMADEDPIGMCDDEAHGDVAIVITKSRSVREVSRSDPLFFKALELTAR